VSVAPERPRAAMILAAGRGERLRPLTDATPKPLLRVLGQPLIERHVRGLARAGVERIVINLAWLGSQISEYLGNGSRYGASIIYSDEQRALETAGGIIRALPHLEPGPFAVVNGDIYTDFPFGTLGITGAMDEQGLALSSAANQYTFSGIAVYRSAFFAGCADGVRPLKPLLVRSMAARRCSAELFDGMWEDVGTPQRLQALNAGQAPS
jgi:MurNAc alpha-1-phosphate uridylyltransferase